jgi:hydroxyacylglutathione hydrolase
MKVWTTKNGHKITRVLHERCNVFLLSNERCNILIDTNLKRNRKQLDLNLNKIGITKLDLLILTHTHFDHTENAAHIQKKYKPKVIVHQSESSWLHQGNSPLPHGSFFFTKLLFRLLSGFLRNRMRYESCLADFEVLDNFSLSEFGFNAYIVHTPGHSSGMMSIIIDDEIAIVGDAMVSHLPWTIYPSFAENKQQLILSWGRLLESNCRLYLPSHGNGIEREKLQRYYKNQIDIA